MAVRALQPEHINFRPGTILKVDMGSYIHFGIVARGGPRWKNPTVISASKQAGEVVEERLTDFIGEGTFVGVDYTPSTVTEGQRVVRRARNWIGTPYDLLRSNCEHFVRRVHGRRPVSPQVWTGLGIGFLLLLLSVK